MEAETPRLPWIEPAFAQARDAFARGRLGHAVLIHAPPGADAGVLARALAALVTCEDRAHAPCGECAACRLLAAGNHPDFHWVEIDRSENEKATQIRIEQIRDLAERLAFKSYRGGYKVGVIAEADAMNEHAANALLKTLEEPPASTLLVLCSARPSRLPATIVSRSHRLVVTLPPRAAALEWLRAQKRLDAWPKLLDLAGGAPLRALELEASGFAALDGEMTATIERLLAGRLDTPGTAERWAKENLELRLTWLDGWLSARIRTALTAPLPARGGIRNIRAQYALLDRVRALRQELAAPLNRQLAAEELLICAETVLAA